MPEDLMEQLRRLLRRAWTKGQLKVALASALNQNGVDAGVAMNAAMEIVDEGRTSAKWRQKLGDAWSDAIDADLADFAS